MKRILGWTLGLTGLMGLTLLGSGIAAAELKVGDAAPDFQLQGTDGKMHKLSDMKGQTVVLAWFPKAFTSG
jgi:peroxiredoxin Q/BCP